MKLFLSLCLLLLMSHSTFGGFTFSVIQRAPGPIVVGGIVIFDVSVATDASIGTINNLGGVTFFLGADDPGAVGGITTGGKFTFGTNDSSTATAAGRTYMFSTAEGGFLNSNDSALVFSATGANRSLSPAGGLLGTLVLSTAGATIGTHTLTFSQLDAIDSSGNNLPTALGTTITGINLNYTITAVPEPSSILLVSLMLVAGVWTRNRCK